MANGNDVTITRSYIDNFSVKEFTKDELIEKYFPDIDASLRSVGMIGFTTEQVSNISEDLFNTATVLFRETFPNRAQIPESIYSHAAIFQLSNIFTSAAACNFILVLEEDAIIKNMENSYDKDTGLYTFYIDKDTVIMVENIPYVLDYDIEMKVAAKNADNYIFSASYVIPDYYKNAITEDNTNNDPYIKIRRGKNNYIAMEVRCHQCTRTVVEETILTSDTVNYPTVDIPFSGYLAAFDVVYKTTTDDDYHTQLKPQVVYSQPTEEPFCYYQLKNSSTLRITFNTKDDFFIPEYNSTIRVTLYTTLGESANFDEYNGTDISISTNNDNYSYPVPYITSAKPLSSSIGGGVNPDIDALQALTVMKYRTATALTSEADLSEYFANYKYLYGNSDVLFIKKRNDIYERIYSAFILMRDNDYIYHTNTLNLDISLSDMDNNEENVYLIEPGTLFKASDEYGYADFYRDTATTAKNKELYKEYYNLMYEYENVYVKCEFTDPDALSVVADDTEPFDPITEVKISDVISTIPDIQVGDFVRIETITVETDNLPYSEFIRATTGTVPSELPDYIADRKMSFSDYKRYKYITSSADEKEKYNDKCMVFDYDSYGELKEYDNPHGSIIDESTGKMIPDNRFLYINPFLIRFKKTPNLVSMYMTYINHASTVDFISQNDKSFVQFITYQLKTNRSFSKEKKYTISLKTGPSVTVSDDYPVINGKIIDSDDGEEIQPDVDNKYNTMNNDLRIFAVLNNAKDEPVCYVEMYPSEYDAESEVYTFTGEFYTDDHITTNGCLRLLPGVIYKEVTYEKCINTSYTSLIVVPENEYVKADRDTNNALLVVADDAETFDPDTEIHLSTVQEDWKPFASSIKLGDYVVKFFNSSSMIRVNDDLIMKHFAAGDVHAPDINTIDYDDIINRTDSFDYIHKTLGDNYYKLKEGSYTTYYHYIYNKTTDTYEKETEEGAVVEYNQNNIDALLLENQIKKWSQVVSLTNGKEILVPMEKVNCTIYTAYRRVYDEETGALVIIDPTNPSFIDGDGVYAMKLSEVIGKYTEGATGGHYVLEDDTTDNYIITNVYDTSTDTVTLLKPLNYVRSSLIFKDFTAKDGSGHYINNIMDVIMYSLPFIRWDVYLQDNDDDGNRLAYFMNTFLRQYDNLTEIVNTKLRNETAIDIKLYNTYGRSKNFTIGERTTITVDNETTELDSVNLLDTVNLSLSFDIWFIPGTYTIDAVPAVKEFIKNEIETINGSGMNNLYISNLMRKIELKFSYVDHIRFNNINGYDTRYQAVKELQELDELTVSERRMYVPEFLVVDTDDITINEFYSS